MANKERITVTIDADVLERIDKVCEARGEPRSSMIARLVRNGISEQEDFIRETESPLYRAIYRAFTSHPGALEVLAKVVGEELSEEDLARITEGMPEQLRRGQERAGGKRQKKQSAEPGADAQGGTSGGPALEG